MHVLIRAGLARQAEIGGKMYWRRSLGVFPDSTIPLHVKARSRGP